MPQTNWKEIRNAFSPFDSIPPSKLNQWFVTRPDSRVEFLARQLSPDELPARRILVGQPASGKSSELTKLASELKRRYDAMVVRFDLSDNLDVERANPVEVIFLMGTAIFKVAMAEMPVDLRPDKNLLEKLKKGLETVVHTEKENKQFTIDLEKILSGLIVFGGYALAGPPGGAATLAATPFIEKLNPFRFASGTSVELVRQLKVEPKIEELLGSLNAIIDDVHSKTGRRLILLVDGLDKLRDTDVISLNFLEKKFLNGPKCNVVYTGPLDLYYSTKFGGVRSLFEMIPFTHVKLYDPVAQTTSTQGYDFMREVVRCRMTSLNLTPDDVIKPDALDLLIQGSGGVMRDFIRLVKSAALYADINNKNQIETPEATDALNELRRQLKAQLTPEFDTVLEQVKTSRKRIDGEPCDLLLRNDIVLSYFNKDVWFDKHAALTDQPW